MDSKQNVLYNILKNRFTANAQFFKDIRSINYSLIKGEVLSLYAYGGFGKRLSSDIDILVSKESICILEEALTNNGFFCRCTNNDKRFLRIYTHQYGVWNKQISPIDCVSIDINHDLFWGEYIGQRINIDEFVSDNVEMNIYGVTVKALTPLKTLIQLILHNYKDMNSIFLLATRKKFKRTMFADVYNLIKTNNITLNEFYDKCNEYKILPYAYYILYYTHQVYQDTILKKYVDAVATDEGRLLLPCYGLSEHERKSWKCSFETRLNANNLYELIMDDLDEFDISKIEINRKIMMGQ